MPKVAIYGTAMAVLATVANLLHAVSHVGQHVLSLEAWQWVYVICGIFVAPIAAALLLWTRYRLAGAWLLLVSMAGSFVFDFAYHFLVPGPDNVFTLWPGVWSIPFWSSAVLLMVVSGIGTLVGGQVVVRISHSRATTPPTVEPEHSGGLRERRPDDSERTPPGDRGADLRPAQAATVLDMFVGAGFSVLARTEDEIVVGGIERFSRKRTVIGLERPDLASFRNFDEPGCVKIGFNFRFTDGKLTTETRVKATDARSRRLFGLYWIVIRPGSGLIRHVWLRAIRRRTRLFHSQSLTRCNPA